MISLESPLSALKLAESISEQVLALADKADSLQNQLKRLTPTPLDDFPALIKKKRKSLGLSMESAAELSGLSRSAYQSIEKGDSSPKLDSVKSICNVLGLKVCVI